MQRYEIDFVEFDDKDMVKSDAGDYVLYKDAVAEIDKRAQELTSFVGHHEVQTDEMSKEIVRLRSALTEILEYPEERASCGIAEKALEHR